MSLLISIWAVCVKYQTYPRRINTIPARYDYVHEFKITRNHLLTHPQYILNIANQTHKSFLFSFRLKKYLKVTQIFPNICFTNCSKWLSHIHHTFYATLFCTAHWRTKRETKTHIGAQISLHFILILI